MKKHSKFKQVKKYILKNTMKEQIIKIAKFTTIHDTTHVIEMEFKFDGKSIGTSKKIFDYLSTNFSLDLIHEIETKKAE